MSSKSSSILPIAALGGAVLLAFHALTLDGKVLASFDTLVYFYPNAHFLADRLRSWSLPLWDPYLFAGVPFLANSQVGALYPPHLLYLLGPVSLVYSWLIALHIFIAGVGTFVLARQSLRLGATGSLVAALAFSLSGTLGSMTGHLNQLEALAWLPWLMLCVDRATTRRSRSAVVGGAVVLALSALAGHTQALYITAMAGLVLGVSRIVEDLAARVSITEPADTQLDATAAARGRAPRRPEDEAGDKPPRYRMENGRSLVMTDLRSGSLLSAGRELFFAQDSGAPYLLALFLLGTLLAMAQLVPTAELTRQSIRASGLSLVEASSFSLPPWMVLVSLFPTIGQPPPFTEWDGYIGVSSLLLAGIGVALRPRRPAWWLVALALVGLALSFGRYSPVYLTAYYLVPGVSLFRVPARWLALWTIGVALLAGWGAEALLASAAEGLSWPTTVRVRQWVGRAIIAVLFLALLRVVQQRLLPFPAPMARPGSESLALWLMAVVAIGFAVWLAQIGRPRILAVLIPAIVAAELLTASTNLVYNNAIWPQAVEGLQPPITLLQTLEPRQGLGDRVLGLGNNSFDPGDLAELRGMLNSTLPKAAVNDYMTAIKHADGLTPNLPLRFGLPTIDGYDGGLLPLKSFATLQDLFPNAGAASLDGRLRLQLESAPDPRLLAWLNVRFLLMDRLADRWLHGVYYDLGVTQSVSAGADLALPVSPPAPATAVGIIVDLTPGQRGTLTVKGGGTTTRLDLPSASFQAIEPAVAAADPWSGGVAELTILPFSHPIVPTNLRLAWSGTTPLTLRALSLIDLRTGTSEPVVVSPAYHLVYLGDVKIYENREVMPRAFLAAGLRAYADPSELDAALRSPSWNPRQTALTLASTRASSSAFQGSAGHDDTAVIQIDRPEDISIAVHATQPRVLVLTDSDYPGWQATIDGRATAIVRVDGLFRGVIVPPGVHTVVFSFAPLSWRIGLALSGLGLFGLVVLAVGHR